MKRKMLTWLLVLSLVIGMVPMVTFAEVDTTTGPIANLPDLGIYPGEKQDDGTWVAYDAPYEEPDKAPDAATVKAVIKLPQGQEVPEGCKPFIRRVQNGEGYYPTGGVLEKAVRDYNDFQVYAIHWVKLDGENYNLDTGITNRNMTISIQYLTEDAKLKGAPGKRKLKIFAVKKSGNELEELPESLVTDVQLGAGSNGGYNGFTFVADEKECPFVFVSKKLPPGYVKQLTVDKIVDGSGPFDNDDAPGNDSGENNKIVRSYDTITYTIIVNFDAREEAVVEKEIGMHFEIVLKKGITSARFNTDNMKWMGTNYNIEYLDEEGRVVVVQNHEGKFYAPLKDDEGNALYDENGFVKIDGSREIRLNSVLSGSNKDKDSYKAIGGQVTQQRITGWTNLKVNEKEPNILAAQRGFTASVDVRNADNGEVFQPTFRAWVDGNDENYGMEKDAGGNVRPAQKETGNQITAEAVTASAGTNFNVQLMKNDDMTYKSWFNFATGDEIKGEKRDELERLAALDENHGKANPAEYTEKGRALSSETQNEYADYRYGRISCYGITLQLYNDTDNNPQENRASKGLKGLSLPVGDITFDLNLSSEVTSGGQPFEGSGTEYTAMLWDYHENIPLNNSYTYKYIDPDRGTVELPGDGFGNGKRRMHWAYEVRSSYAKGAAPSNYPFYFNGCYYGGNWSLVGDDGSKADDLKSIKNISSPSKVTGTGADTTYHFSVSDYDFDFDERHFPWQNAGNTGDVANYKTYAKCFSAGAVQVINVFPRVQKQSNADIHLDIKVSNLNLKTRVGQELKPDEKDKTGYKHEVNRDDNERNDQIVLYAPGNITKGSSFNGAYEQTPDKEPWAVNQSYLGTEYWDTSYDCSAFAGDNIWIIGYGMISANSDYRMKASNLLQLFDSRALSIRTDNEPKISQNLMPDDTGGIVKFLYAADPDYPQGYDTNTKDKDGKYVVMEYMNTVREEDLVYSADKPDKGGYITVGGDRLKCVGVLTEIRGCDIMGGQYQYARIPVKVRADDEELISKTVGTVNVFRVWTDEKDMKKQDGSYITWADGKWNKSKGKNELAGYKVPEGFNKETGTYSAECGNKDTTVYKKTEYKDGKQVAGTHSGGVQSGNSLLLLGYQAGINITIDNKGDVQQGSINYNQGQNETVVDYRLTNIETKVSALTGQTEVPVTHLTIRTVLDEGHSGLQRISVSGGTYKMEGYEVDETGKPTGGKKQISIGTDKENPTKIAFEDSDGKMQVIKIYAAPQIDGRAVNFEIDDVPVGIMIPDITFQANFAPTNALKDNDTIKTVTYISGSGDQRAYSKAKGNTDNITIGVVLESGTNLGKRVEQRYIEMNGLMFYTVTYTNSGSAAIPKIYFYDLISEKGDIRGSDFEGDTILRTFGIELSGTKDELKGVSGTVYCSNTEYWELYNNVVKFGGTDSNSSPNEAGVEDMLANGKDSQGKNLFYVLGTITDGKFNYDGSFSSMDKAELEAMFSKVTGLYVKLENLHGGQSVDMEFKVETSGNENGDIYKNVANSWIAGSPTLPLKSNLVETAVIGREISGMVWYDWDLDGIRNEKEKREKPIENVTVTLLKKNGEGKYELCEKDITGAEIKPVVTGEDGTYSFKKLVEGDYIVAFSGEAIESYTGATIYQQKGKNDANTNDGVAISELKADMADGVNVKDYAYFIKYSPDSEQINLHSFADITSGKVQTSNYAESIAHQDLGVTMSGNEMPKVGGMGTLLYITAGTVTLLITLLAWSFIRRRRYCE